MTRTRQARTGERGFTLVELMVAVALSGIVIGFVFQIHNQMVGALRGQANLSEVVETVTAAREMIAREARLAGMGFPPAGVQFGTDPALDIWRGVDGTNDADGAGADIVDQLAIQRIDGDLFDVHAADQGAQFFYPILNADTLGFNLVDPIMLGNDLMVAACAPVPAQVDATGIWINTTAFDPGAVCDLLTMADNTAVKIARIRRITFRLDPAAPRYELGVLQRAINGGAWEDIGIGFTNLQIAIRYSEKLSPPGPDGTDLDGDGDGGIDWYSGEAMELVNALRPGYGRPAQIGLSIEARNLRRLDNLASSTTPGYIDMAHPDNNPLGNFGQACAGGQYDPCGVADLSAMGLPPRYQFPDHVYRSSSTTVWLRARLESL